MGQEHGPQNETDWIPILALLLTSCGDLEQVNVLIKGKTISPPTRLCQHFQGHCGCTWSLINKNHATLTGSFSPHASFISSASYTPLPKCFKFASSAQPCSMGTALLYYAPGLHWVPVLLLSAVGFSATLLLHKGQQVPGANSTCCHSTSSPGSNLCCSSRCHPKQQHSGAQSSLVICREEVPLLWAVLSVTVSKNMVLLCASDRAHSFSSSFFSSFFFFLSFSILSSLPPYLHLILFFSYFFPSLNL